MSSLEGECYKIICVCSYGCALCGEKGERKNRNVRNLKKQTNKKKSCYSVKPARARGINLAGVTVPDLNLKCVEDPYFPEWLMSRRTAPASSALYGGKRSSVCILERSQNFSSTRGHMVY